jgi:hypothetical protein
MESLTDHIKQKVTCPYIITIMLKCERVVPDFQTLAATKGGMVINVFLIVIGRMEHNVS